MKKIVSWILTITILFSIMSGKTQVNATTVNTDNVEVNTEAMPNLNLTSKATILMEASTGTIVYENNADEQLSPASITKIMTLILIFDALKDGKIKKEDLVTTSAHAKSMGGSQVFLEEGEQQTVDTMIKCIVVASGNDASVAMAEHISGSESEFVNQMNIRAKGLSMNNTNFEDCCGLTESKSHYSSARDVAIMSRELITLYPEIHNYSTIWMENITHVTAQGTKEFGLSNTNKLLKQYEWATGLKTGSTSVAKYCVSATARKDDIDMIAVVMAAPDYKIRFSEAIQLFNYGYANCKVYKDNSTVLEDAAINNGIKDQIKCSIEKEFSYLSTTGEDLNSITNEIIIDEISAPISQGDVIGKIVYSLNGTEVGQVNIVANEDVRQNTFKDYMKKAWKTYLIN